MRISLFTDTFPPQVNGVSLTLERLVHHLEHRRIPHLVLAPETEEQDLFSSNILRFSSFPFFLYPECRIALPNYFSIRNHLQQFKPDLIHVATPFNMGLIGRYYGKKYHIPMVASYHTHFDRYLDYYRLNFTSHLIWHYMRWFHEPCIRIFAPSQDTKSDLMNQGFSHIGIWSRGVDCNLFHPNKKSGKLREKYQIREPFILLYVGRMAPEKDLDVLLEAVKKLPGHLSKLIHWVFVGEGPLLEEMRGKKTDHMTFTGYLNGEPLAEVYASADLFVFPSSTETFGNVVLEAAASGLPAIGVRSGGVKEIIRHGETGLLCKPRDSDYLAQAIEQLLSDPAQLQTMGKAARRYALNQSWENIFDRLLAEYEQAIYSRQTISV
ncbi:glycosyltransferase family 4 protein [Ferviditalea candida]|uniref:Glycosyltransferase family 1 protein n=1 Tax=Ferviditalea candida TaxID=3108399 RepID=A0ABU5ZMN7_9BACL|nr:glycosyltransferase family 1 protein [Paenibacillaceae bacterium T2]